MKSRYAFMKTNDPHTILTQLIIWWSITLLAFIYQQEMFSKIFND